MKPTDYIENIDGAERRYLSQPLEYREEGEEKRFEGYAVIFNSETDLGWFTEEIRDGAFEDVMNDDVRGLFNHDPDVILGRSKSGTMKLTVDARGVKYSIDYNPNDPDHVRVMEKVKRGDVSQSSFAFGIKDAVWETREGRDHRVITKLSRWYDVSPVTYPAYQDTTVAARSFEQVKKELEPGDDNEEFRAEYTKKFYETII
jgi:HK97 family phage prohead protease